MSFYRSGSITLTKGSRTVTSDGSTVFLSQAAQGDLVTAPGGVGVVDAVNSQTTLTLASPWTGETVTTADYTVAHTGSYWHSTVTVNEKIAALLARIEQLINGYSSNLSLQLLALSNATVPENASANTVVGTVRNITTGSTVSLVNNAGGRFVLNGDTLTTGSTPLDYETSTTHTITLRETLAGVPNSPRDTSITIAVQDVADSGGATLNALTLSANALPENSPQGYVVGYLQGATSGSVLTLTNTAGNRFILSGDTVMAGSVPTDYEAATSHVITVRETLAGATNTPRDTNLTITVTDVVEGGGTTLAALALSNASVPENSAQGTVIGAVQNKTSGSTLTLANDAGGRFAISGNNLVCGSVMLDFETATSHQVTIRETLTGATNTPRDTTLTVSVTDVQEGGSPTLQALSLSNATVTENVAQGTVIGAVQGKTAASTLTLTNDGGGRAALSGTNLVTGATAIDYEAAASFTVTVRETLAGATNTPRDTTFTVTVNNLLEKTLNAISLSSATIAENSAPGTVIGALQGITGGSTLTLTDNAGGKVAISGTNLVAGATNIDYEVTPTFTCAVRETHPDANNSPRDTTLTITVQNVAEGGVTLGALTLNNASIAEGAAAGTPVGQIQGTAAGSSLSLTDSAGGRFALNGLTLVTGSTATDYEIVTSHTVTIRETLTGATGSPKDTTLTISVVNVTEPTGSAGRYASASDTGIPAGRPTPQVVSGNIDFNTPNVVYEDKIINGNVRIYANNVEIRYCKINGKGGGRMGYGIYVDKGVTGAYIHHNEIDGSSPLGPDCAAGIGGCGRFENNNIYHTENGINVEGWVPTTIKHNYIWNMYSNPPEAHKDCIQIFGEAGGDGAMHDVVTTENTCINDSTQDWGTSVYYVSTTFGRTRDTYAYNNYFDGVGGSYTMYVTDQNNTDPNAYVTNTQIYDNYIAEAYWGIWYKFDSLVAPNEMPIRHGNVEVTQAQKLSPDAAPWIVNGVQMPQGSGGSATLAALALTNASLPSGSPQGWVVGTVRQTTQGSTLTLVNDAGGRFALNGRQLVAGATPTDYAAATSHSITLRETLSGATGSPKDTTLTVTVSQTGGGTTTPTLNALTLSNAQIAENSAAGTVIGTVNGLTTGSTLTLTNDGGGRASLSNGQIRVGSTPIDYETTPSFTITLRESLTGATNTPRDSTITISVIDVAEGGAVATLDNVWATTATVPGTAQQENSTGIVLGTEIAINKTGYILGVTFPRALAQALGDGTVGLYRTDNGSNTLVASKAYTGLTGLGICGVRFDSPVAVTAGQSYRVVQLVKPNAGVVYYRQTSNVFGSGATVPSVNGALTARQGYYVYATALAFPTATFGNSAYYIDAIFSDTPVGTLFSTNYPSASSAGVPAGTTLAPRGTGAVNTISVDGTIWDAQDVNGPIVVNANNVTIRKCKVTGSTATAVIECPAAYTGLKVEDCTLIGGGAQGGNAGIQAGGLSMQRNDISGVRVGIRIDDGNEALVVAGNYIHGLAATGGTTGYLGIDMQAKRTSTTIKHNTVDMATLGGESAIRLTNTFGNNANAVIEDNYIFGPLSAIKVDNSATAGAITALSINKNLIRQPGTRTAGDFEFYAITPTLTGNLTVG